MRWNRWHSDELNLVSHGRNLSWPNGCEGRQRLPAVLQSQASGQHQPVDLSGGLSRLFQGVPTTPPYFKSSAGVFQRDFLGINWRDREYHIYMSFSSWQLDRLRSRWTTRWTIQILSAKPVFCLLCSRSNYKNKCLLECEPNILFYKCMRCATIQSGCEKGALWLQKCGMVCLNTQRNIHLIISFIEDDEEEV